MFLSNQFNATNIVFDAPEEPDHTNSFGVWAVDVEAEPSSAQVDVKHTPSVDMQVMPQLVEVNVQNIKPQATASPEPAPEETKPTAQVDDNPALSKNEQERQAEELRAFHAGNKDGGAEKIGQMERTNATIREVEIKQNKDKDSEAFQRQLMLRRLMQDMQNTLGRINAAIDATEKLRILYKQGKLDYNNQEYIDLLQLSDMSKDDIEVNGDDAFERKLESLRDNASKTQNFIDNTSNLDSDDPEFEEKIQQLSNDFEMGRLKAREFVSNGTEENRTHALAKIGFNEQEQAIVSNSITDDFSDDFSIESKVSISAATDIQGEAIKNAPDLQGDFIAATKPQTTTTEPAPDNTPTPAVTTTIKFDIL